MPSYLIGLDEDCERFVAALRQEITIREIRCNANHDVGFVAGLEWALEEFKNRTGYL